MVTLITEAVEVETVGSGKEAEEKLVVTFKGTDKKLALNRTNADALAEVAGTGDYSKWGKQVIELLSAKAQMGNKVVDAVRLRKAGMADVDPELGI